MRKTLFMVAALAATLPFVATSAFAQLDRGGGRGGAAPAARAAAPSVGGGGMRGGFVGGRGGVAVAPQAGGAWAGRQGWVGNPGWSGNTGWQGRRHVGRVFGPSVYFGGAYAGYPYGYQSYYGDDYYYDDAPGVAVAPGIADDDAVAYCQQRYRSYDVNSGTFLGFDGQRHPCP